MKNFELAMERFIFHSRWLLAPFYLGLIMAIVMLLIKFLQESISLIPGFLDHSYNELILSILTLVDLLLVANLLLIIIFSGYESFVSKLDIGDHVDRPEWINQVGYSGLKIKLIGSIVTISGIELLKAFIKVEEMGTDQLMWKVGIHLTFVISGVLFAIMDRISHSTK